MPHRLDRIKYWTNVVILQEETQDRITDLPFADYDLSVVIVSWNVADLLRRCLEALISPHVLGGLRVEVIVVDNASSDASTDVARSFAEVRVIRSRINLGYGRANNIGFEIARGKYLLVLNPDTIPQPGCLRALLTFAEKVPQAGAVAPRLLNEDGSDQVSAFRFPTLAMAVLDLYPLPRAVPGRIRHWISTSRLNGRYSREPAASRPFRLDHPLGAAMLLRREAVDQVGGFDENLFMYSEEIDLAFRLAAAGWECWQVPTARIIHLGGQSTRQMPDRMLQELWRSRIYVFYKHRGRIPTIGLRSILAFAQIVQLIMTALRRTTGKASRGDVEARLRRAKAILRIALGGNG